MDVAVIDAKTAWDAVSAALDKRKDREKAEGKVYVQCTVCKDAPYHPLVVPALEWQCPNSAKHPKVPAREYVVGTKGSDTVMRVK